MSVIGGTILEDLENEWDNHGVINVQDNIVMSLTGMAMLKEFLL